MILCQDTILKLEYNTTNTETQLDNNNTESQSRQLGAAFLVVGWIAVIALITVLINGTLFSTKAASISETDAGKQITIQRDRDSHFRIKGSINGIAVTFLIDTGATSVAIPSTVAEQAKLTKKTMMTTETAGGETIGYLTRIEKINIGGVEIQNISAVIIPELDRDQALLGMNVLQKFSITQTKDTMILTVPRTPH